MSRPTTTSRLLSRRQLGAAALAAAGLAGCRPRGGGAEVVVYTSLDEPYARPVLEAFTRETGVRAVPVFDTEATKSRGLAQKLLEERDNPRGDVFWSSEVLQMLRLKEAGVLAPYRSPSAEEIPEQFRDPDGHWTGFAGRFRVLVYYRPRVSEPPQSLLDLTDPRWRGEVAMANPAFGTTTTEAVALFQILGPERAKDYFRARAANETRIVDGNSVAAERTARGDVLIGQTDTDDAYIRMDESETLGLVFPDQNGFGALMIPNTAGLIAGAPHAEQGRAFLDYLLRPETELLLAGLPSRQLPLHPGLEARLPEAVRPLADVKTMDLSYPRLLEDFQAADRFLRETFGS